MFVQKGNRQQNKQMCRPNSNHCHEWLEWPKAGHFGSYSMHRKMNQLSLKKIRSCARQRKLLDKYDRHFGCDLFLY